MRLHNANSRIILARPGEEIMQQHTANLEYLCISNSGLWRRAPMRRVVAGRAPRLKEVAV